MCCKETNKYVDDCGTAFYSDGHISCRSVSAFVNTNCCIYVWSHLRNAGVSFSGAFTHRDTSCQYLILLPNWELLFLQICQTCLGEESKVNLWLAITDCVCVFVYTVLPI